MDELDSTDICLIAGLGNPGEKYENTRHNIGFLFLDYLAGSKGGWRKVKGALRTTQVVLRRELELVKPIEFMNLSGKSISQIMNFKKLSVNSLVVAHDDVDLPFGSLRLKLGGSSGGHNGLRSIDSELGSSSYYRLRFGVGRPPEQREQEMSSWVLSRFSATELGELEEIFFKARGAVETLVSDGLAAAQNRYNS